MFCSKCGTKMIDGAAFCQKCGAKLIQYDNGEQKTVPLPIQKSEERPVPFAGTISGSEQQSVEEENELAQAPSSESARTSTSSVKPNMKAQYVNIHGESSSMSGSDEDIYALLKSNIDRCPAIKSAKQIKNGVRLRGGICRYTVRLVTIQLRIRSILTFPFSILYGLLTGLLCAMVVIILQELIKYGSICIEYYHGILFSFCSLVMGVVVLLPSLAGRKERGAVENYVRNILESQQIYLSEKKRIIVPAIKIGIAVALIAVGIIILPLNLPESVKYSDELLFDGLPIARFLEMTQEDVELEFGEIKLTGTNGITGDDYYYYYGIDHVVYSKETGKVIYIKFDASRCTYNRKKLDKSMARVWDILDDGYWVYPSEYWEVYGSIHSGFYFSDGVYAHYTGALSESYADAENSSVVQKFENDWDSTYLYRYSLLGMWEKQGDGYAVSDDCEIALITLDWKNLDEPNELYFVCLYTKEWVETVNAAVSGADGSDTGDLCYGEIPLVDLMYKSKEEVYSSLGSPIGGTPVTGQRHFDGMENIEYYEYDGLTLYFNNQTNVVDGIYVRSNLVRINGETMEKNRTELISLLGQPTNEDSDESSDYMVYTLYGEGVNIAISIPHSPESADEPARDILVYAYSP